MPITFDRAVCCDLEETISREWLISNGLGGYASGTVAGTLTRMQQGLLVAPLNNDPVPQLLLAKIDEEVLFDQRTYYLGTNEYRDSTLNPAGFVHLEAFRLEEGFPIFTYRLGGINGIMLEKRIWMPQEQNTTYIQYRVLRTSTPQESAGYFSGNSRSTSRAGYERPYGYLEGAHPSLTLTLLPLVAHRPYDQPQPGQHDGEFQVQVHQQRISRPLEENEQELALPRGVAGCTIRAHGKQAVYHILAIGHAESQTQFIPTGVWYWHFLRRHDQAAGLPATDDLYLPGVVRARLWPASDSALTIIVTTEELTALPLNQRQVNQTYEQALDYQRSLLHGQKRYFGEGGGSIQTLPVLPFTSSSSVTVQNEEFLQLLYQAGDRLLTRRTLPYGSSSGAPAFFFRAAEHMPTITSGYYGQANDTRASLIALPGLTLTTQRYSEARQILRHIGRLFRHGLLPNCLPTAQRPELPDEEYTNVDNTLWYCYALDKYLGVTQDYELLDELYQRLAECAACYIRGTSHGIGVDPADGLLRTGSKEHALTWMNACAQGKLVTPRTGKAVEVNALWYHALSLLYEWSQLLYQRGRINHSAEEYAERAQLCRRSFHERFWYPAGGYLYDVVDGPEGDDASLRPNQLLACSLRFAVLNAQRQGTVLDIVTQELATPYGLRTLAPGDASYQGQLPQKQAEVTRALHQGGAWPWLIGPYIDTMLRVGERPLQEAANSTRPDLYKEYIWRKGLQVLEPFCQQMQREMLGSISEVYAGDAPHCSGPVLASALSSGEILRAYRVLAHLGVQQRDQALSF